MAFLPFMTLIVEVYEFRLVLISYLFLFLLFTSIYIPLHNYVLYTDTLPHIESQLLHKVETVSHSLYLHNLYLPYISCSFVLGI